MIIFVIRKETYLVLLSIFLLVIQVALAKERLLQEYKLISFEERATIEDSTLKICLIRRRN